MKHTKDRMGDPMSVSEMNQLLDVLKTTGASHIEVATVIGHPNFVSYSKQWADAIHAKGMNVTWRCAHQNMEFERDMNGNPTGKGLYGATSFIGVNRKPAQFWIDEAVKAATALGTLVKSGDEWAIYPERTEGIFSDNTAFLWEGLPGSYAEFFINMNNACKAVLPTGAAMGLSANNGSELLNGWMPASLINYAGAVVIDHYRDGDPTLYETEVRAVGSRYNKPVYVQEGAPHRSARPTRAQANTYFAVNKKLADDGVLVGFGSWSGWAGTPESIVDKVGGVYELNESGESLKAWWGNTPTPEPTPDPEPEPTPNPEPSTEKIVQIYGLSSPMALTNKGRIFKYSSTTKKWSEIITPVLD